MGNEGRIKLGVEFVLDKSEKFTGTVKERLNGLNGVLAKTEKRMQAAFQGNSTLEQRLARQNEAVRKQQVLLDGLKTKYDALLSGEAQPKALIAIEKELKKVQTEIARADADFEKLAAEQQGILSKGISIGGRPYFNDADTARLAELDRLIIENGKHTDELTAKAVHLKNEIAHVKLNPESGQEAQELAGKIDLASDKLMRLKNEARSTEAAIQSTGDRGSKSIDKISGSAQRSINPLEGVQKSFQRFGMRIGNLIKQAFVFNVISAGLRKMQQGIANVIQSNGQLSYSLQSIKGNLLTAFAPIYDAILPALQTLISWIASATAHVSAFINMLFGKSVSASTATANALNKQAAATRSAGREAKKTAKEVDKATASFDELNILTNQRNAEANGGGAGGVDVSPVVVTNVDTSAWSSLLGILTRIKELFTDGFWDGFGDHDFTGLETDIESIKKSLTDIWSDPKLINAAGTLIDTWIYNIGVETGAFASVGMSLAIALTGGVANWLDTNKTYISQKLTSMFDILTEITTISGNTAKTYAQVFGNVFESEGMQILIGNILGTFSVIGLSITELALKIGRDFMDMLTFPVIANKENLSIALTGIVEVFASMSGTIQALVKQLFEGVIKLYDEHISPFIESVKIGLAEWVEKILEGWNTYIKPVLDEFAAKFREVVEQHVSPMIDRAMKLFGGLFDLLKLYWEKTLKPVVSWIVDIAAPLIGATLEVLGGQFNFLLAVVSDVFSFILDILNGAITFLTGVFTADWETAWNGIYAILKTVWNNIVTGIEGGINLIVDGLNALIRNINSISGAIGDAVGVNLRIPEVPHAKLPRLAQGAVIPPNREFLAVLGDQRHGTNIETPLDTMVQAFKTALSEMGYGQRGDVVLKINDREFARATIDALNYEKNRRGTKLVTGGAF